jgi:hypothetical protein
LERLDHPLRRRSRDYCIKIHAWLVAHDCRSSDSGPNDLLSLIGIERSHALLGMADSGSAVVSLIGDLEWMTDALDRLFPNARSFIRPAFDEPEAVARLLADLSAGW